MIRYLHISMQLQGDVDTENLKTQLNKAIDWIHYMPNCWIVLTTSDPMRWYERLASLLGDSDFVLIAPIDMEEARGWLPNWVIEWTKAAKTKTTNLALAQQPEEQKLFPPKS
ncbi:MAG: hypothetical protein ACYDC3_13825 [Candidatus Binataceae bacterium]